MFDLSRALCLVSCLGFAALAVCLCSTASAQRAPQLIVGGGGSPISEGMSMIVDATVIGWPGTVGVAAHAEYGRRYWFDDEPSSARIGVLAALDVPAGPIEIVLAAGPSLSRDTEPHADEAPGWRVGGMGRAQFVVPLEEPIGLAVGFGLLASADGVRPSLTAGLSLRLGR